MLKLYFSPAACSLAPHIVLHECQIPFEPLRVNLKEKTYSGGDYRQVNSKGSVPAIQLENGQVLTEAAVIMQYVADLNPQAGMLPPVGSWERYRCLEWLNFIATELHKGFGPLWKPDTPADYKPVVLTNLTQRLDLVNAHLAHNDFLMGQTFTAADAYLFTVANWSHYLKIDLNPWPNVQKFMERVKARPATMAAMKTEGLNK